MAFCGLGLDKRFAGKFLPFFLKPKEEGPRKGRAIATMRLHLRHPSSGFPPMRSLHVDTAATCFVTGR